MLSYGLKQTAEPAAEPIHLNEARLYLKIDDDVTEDDSVIESAIISAREHVEEVLRGALVAQTWTLKLEGWPSGGEIEIPLPPLMSVASVTYTTSDGTTETLSTSDYTVETDSEPTGRILLNLTSYWPSSALGVGLPISIQFTAGYVTPVSANPSTDVLTASGRTFSNGAAVTLSVSGGSVPTGLAERTTYYVVNASGSTFKLAATANGSAIDFTNAGSGQVFVGRLPDKIRRSMLLLIWHFYQNRGTAAEPIPEGVDTLILSSRARRF